MTDTTTAPVETEAPVPAQDFSEYEKIAEFWKSIADKANGLAAQIKAAREKPEAAVDHILSTSDDENVAKWRAADKHAEEQIKAAQERREQNRRTVQAYAASKLLPTATEGFDAEKAKAAFIELRQKSNGTHNTIEAMVGSENIQAFMDSFGIVEVVSLGRNSTGDKARGSTNIRRPRLASATVNGEDVTPPTFTNLAAKVSSKFGAVDGDTLRDAAFKAAGTQDLSSLDAGSEVNFTVVVGENNVSLSVTTKGKPGPSVKADASEPVSDDSDESVNEDEDSE